MATMEALKILMKDKDKMEAEIKELSEVLTSQGGVGMTDKLVDAEGYPRADIDVHSVRTARHRIICLQNDHKALMKQIEEGLYDLHTKARETNSVDNGSSSNTEGKTDSPFSTDESQAIAKVDRVEAYSPASTAGLKVGDFITFFDDLSIINFRKLEDIGHKVQHLQGQSLTVTVIRNTEIVHLKLTPMKWSGRGLLGCHLVPIEKYASSSGPWVR